jgi:hypothetical protein
MDYELFLPVVSPKINNCYHTKLFKLLFFVPGVKLYLNVENPNIRKKFSHVYDKSKKTFQDISTCVVFIKIPVGLFSK